MHNGSKSRQILNFRVGRYKPQNFLSSNFARLGVSWTSNVLIRITKNLEGLELLSPHQNLNNKVRSIAASYTDRVKLV